MARQDYPCKLLWGNKFLPKVEVFAWMEIQKWVLTKDKLATFGVQGPRRCVMCKKSEDSTDHLLLTCPYASSYWNIVRRKLNLQCPMPKDIETWFKMWPLEGKKLLFGGIWQLTPSTVIWEIQKGRNKRIFQGKEMSVDNLWEKIERAIIELVNEDAHSKARK